MFRLALILLFAACAAQAGPRPPAAAVASAHPLATRAGMQVLAEGGNAFDAAVAVSATLAVAEPYSSGLGGGGFWLLHRASDGREVVIDGRERAPLAASRNMYQDEFGEVIPGKSMDGPLAAAIPGEPAALAHIAYAYGRLPLGRSLAPAIKVAREGFAVSPHYRRMARFRRAVLQASPAAAAVFLDHGEVPALGHTIRQPDLARTLEAIASHGRAGFYAGNIAELLVKQVHAAGGIWSQRDLHEYRVIERKPISFIYHGLRVVSAPPPSSGGVMLSLMLNILSGYPLQRLDQTTRDHLMIEAMRRAYRDRAEYLGDPDYVRMPLQRLTSPDYAAGLRASIRLDRATPSDSLPGIAERKEGPHTTHFSIIDRDGNWVSATLSVNYPFGSGFMPAGTGVLLNDEMDDFSAKPGSPNAYGLVGAEANAIAPGKRMLSSMSPSFVEGPDRVAILGTPGGSRIITMVLLGILDVADGHGPAHWVSRPRFHHQYLPDRVEYEPNAFSAAELAGLAAMGHHLQAVQHTWGNMQAVLWDKRANRVEAASDPRGEGEALVGEAGRAAHGGP